MKLCDKCNCYYGDKYFYTHYKKCKGKKKKENSNLTQPVLCKWCKEKIMKNYIHLHERTCKLNPNKFFSWNKGLTKDIDSRVNLNVE